MEAARRIRAAVARIDELRERGRANAPIALAVKEVKRFQADRFSGTYADILSAGPYRMAARFFLQELYGDKEYAERDAQFARIAGAIERFFPRAVAATCVTLAELHALTEELDHAMGVAWLEGEVAASETASLRYVRSWREVGRRQDRIDQLSTVLAIGRELAALTRAPGLSLMLKMMRPAAAGAGLGSLQRFLEAGFDTFAALARDYTQVDRFLGLIDARERSLIESLFDLEISACADQLGAILGQAR